MDDKRNAQQVLGGLMLHPQYLSEIDKYNLSVSDFSSLLERYIFTAIGGLYEDGAKTIRAIDIETRLSTNASAKVVFEKNNGIEYVQDLEMLADPSNFEYYYNRLKKFNLLRDLKKQGFDISDFYEENLVDVRANEINQKFESLTIQDIIEQLKKKLLKTEAQYNKTENTTVEKLTDGIEELVEGFGSGEEIGTPIQGTIINHIISGARKGTLTIMSAPSGVSKTRTAIGNACYMAFPIRFNSLCWSWEQKGNCEKVLVVITEQSYKEVQKMVLAYLTDINQSRFRYGDFTEAERKVISQAIEVMKTYEDNFTIMRIPDPNVSMIKAMVREQCILHDISALFYDYIFISPNLINEFSGQIRHDEALLLMSTALKDLATELNIAVFTSTQVNSKGDDNSNIRNESALAGSRAIINKADNGIIMARPTKEELELLGPLSSKYGKEPNIVSDVYKVREGQYTQVRVWSYMDLGTLKRTDLFVTDSRLNARNDIFENISPYIMEWDNETSAQIATFLKELNNEGEIKV